MLKTLKEAVCAANLELVKRGVVIYTWGNVSGIDREKAGKTEDSMLERIAGNEELKSSIRRMLEGRRLTG